MLYIKFTKDYYRKLGREKRIKYFWQILKNGFYINKVENGELIILHKINKKTVEKIDKYVELFNIRTVCLSENLKNTEVFEKLQKNSIKILDGKWLYKYLIKSIVKYVVRQKQSDISIQEISILTHKITDIEIENILQLSELCKNMNIVTNQELKLKKLEEYLYDEKGIVLNITHNYNKSLIKSDIIINMDYEEEELNKFCFPRKAIVMSIMNSAKILNKGFDGINILSYKIKIPNIYISEEINLEDFNKEILYESYIYRKTNPKNIICAIENDEVEIECLEGINGKIKNYEYLRPQFK